MATPSTLAWNRQALIPVTSCNQCKLERLLSWEGEAHPLHQYKAVAASIGIPGLRPPLSNVTLQPVL